MEEDIKILEEYLLTLEKMGGIEMLKRGDVLISYVKYKNIQAIENLIKGYRELEKRTISLTNLLCINDSDENYIPKSKVKELHKEYYEKAFAKPYDCTTADYKHSQAMGGWRALNKLLMEDK